MFDVAETSNFPTEPPDLTAPEDLLNELASVFVRRDRVEARAVMLLAEAAETRAFERDGYSSLTPLLKHRMSLHPGEAQRLVRRANSLPSMPLTALAYERGAISGAQVDVLAEIRAIAPEQFGEGESQLIGWAMDTPMVPELRKKLDYWLSQVAVENLASDRHHVREARYLTLRREGEMMRINGWFDIESGERLAAGLEPGPAPDGDTRSTPARRADILLEVLEGCSQRPSVSVLVSAETLLEGLPGVSETSNGTYLTVDEVRRISCDANLTRVVFGPDSQPLDVGRTQRLVTPAQRLVVIARDRHCVFPTCDRPAHWCDAHHIIHWADDGPTAVENLVLLCRHHHTLVHEAGWKITGTPGDLHFHRPDGTELGNEPPPRPWPSPRIFQARPPRPERFSISETLEQIRDIIYPRGP
ncbi:MAG: DUF222 domain-containing protein [Acidimicrobiia bacterium]